MRNLEERQSTISSLSLWTYNLELSRMGQLIVCVNLTGPKGCPYIWLNAISGCVGEGVSGCAWHLNGWPLFSRWLSWMWLGST